MLFLEVAISRSLDQKRFSNLIALVTIFDDFSSGFLLQICVYLYVLQYEVKWLISQKLNTIWQLCFHIKTRNFWNSKHLTIWFVINSIIHK